MSLLPYIQKAGIKTGRYKGDNQAIALPHLYKMLQFVGEKYNIQKRLCSMKQLLNGNLSFMSKGV